MKTPIEMMLETVDWQETKLHHQDASGDDLPWATHEGVFEIAGIKLRCYRLNDGRAIFNADDVHDFLDSMAGDFSELSENSEADSSESNRK